MDQRKMWSYIKLDSYNLLIPFSLTKAELMKRLQDKGILVVGTTETSFYVRSKMWSLDMAFFLSFEFDGDTLQTVTVVPDQALEGRELYARYKTVQKALERELGHPCRFGRSIMNVFDPDGRTSTWQSGGMKVEHSLQNRLSMEEIIQIKL